MADGLKTAKGNEMIYGRSYEGESYECRKCGTFTSEHLHCAQCKKHACAHCTNDDAVCLECQAEEVIARHNESIEEVA